MYFYQPVQWMTVSVAGLCATIVTAHILKNELTKRISGDATFTTKYLKLWSILSISLAPVVAFGTFIQYIHGFCYFTWYVLTVANYCQPILVNFYQLSRLYYCFARTQVYSNKGYPTYLFVVMFLIGIVIVVSGMLQLLFSNGIPSQCGINDHLQFYMQHTHFYSNSNSVQIYTIWFYAQALVYFCWDICALLLYVVKIKTFKKFKTENITIYNRILSIMHRVLILTLFYEICGLFVVLMDAIAANLLLNHTVWVDVVFQLSHLIISTLYSYSIYLMLQHNTSEYVKFLKFLQYFKLNYLCCCYHYCVTDQLNQLTTVDNVVKASKDNTNTNEISYETGGITQTSIETKVTAKI